MNEILDILPETILYTVLILAACVVIAALMDAWDRFNYNLMAEQLRTVHNPAQPTIEEVAATTSAHVMHSRDVYRIFDNDGNVIEEVLVR